MITLARWRNGVDARTVHRPLSWFKSRPGLHASQLRCFGSASPKWRRLPRRSSQSEGGHARLASHALTNCGKITVDGPFLGLHGLGIWSKDASRARGLLTAHDPPKCRRFGVRSCALMNLERDRTQNRYPLLLIALIDRGTRDKRALFLCRFRSHET